MSMAKVALKFTGLFESEVLVELMLRYWKHPYADDAEYRCSLLESASEVLRSSIKGEKLLEGVEPQNMNLIAAIWTVETFAVSQEPGADGKELRERKAWLKKVRRSIPSCFCNPELLE